jgi:hypothetical protein
MVGDEKNTVMDSGRGQSKYWREMDKNTRRRRDKNITYVIKC